MKEIIIDERVCVMVTARKSVTGFFGRMVLFCTVLMWGSGLLAQTPSFKSFDRFTDSTGREIVRAITPVRPPEVKMPSVQLPMSKVDQAGTKTLTTVPAFDWTYGCTATSAGMMFGYYDRNGYPNVWSSGTCPLDNSQWGHTAYPETTCGECPFIASHDGNAGRAGKGFVDDYWVDYLSKEDPYYGNWTEHSPQDCTGDFMRTGQYYNNFNNVDGSTSMHYYSEGDPLNWDVVGDGDGTYGIAMFAQSRGYTVTACFTQLIQGEGTDPAKGFTFANYQTEIDAGRPVLIQVDGHTMIGVGYDTTGNIVYLHDTWDYSSHQMTWGGSYSGMAQWGVTVLQLAAPVVVPSLPTVTTQAVTAIATTTATGNGDITDLGTSNPTAYGVCWNTTGTPTTSNSKFNNGATSATGAFTSSMTGLTPGKRYYVRAYATNASGTAYGGQVIFTTTSVPPTVTTQAVTAITTTTATGNGNVTDLGAPNPSAYGVCWNTTGTPTTSNSKTNNGAKSATGAFTSNMTGLDTGTLYYVRAYATNKSTVYGGQVTFTTNSSSFKAITAFMFPQNISTNIDEGLKTIAITMPYGTNVTSLAPTISVSPHATVSPLSGVALNFTSPKTYTVTAQNSTTQNYTVTVSIAPPSTIATITSATYTVSIVGGGHETITSVPLATGKATFLAALSKGQANQTWNDSGIADPVMTGNTLVVTAQDGTTIVTYTATVNLPVITASAGENGSISPTGAVTVPYNGSQTFTITPNTDCHITDVSVDDSSAGAVASYTFSNVTANHTIAASFAVDTVSYSISGTVSGAVQQGVTLRLSGSSSTTSASGADGTFKIAKLSNGSYTVTPNLSGYTFAPSSRSFTVNGKNVTGCDFIATKNPGQYSMGGTVSGDVQEGVTITLSGTLSSTTVSDASGEYSFTGLAAGNYTVTPKLSGYIFTPFFLDVTISGADQTGIDFTATSISIYGQILKPSSFNALHKESAKKIDVAYEQYSTDKFTILATIQFPEAFDLTTIGESTGFTFDFGFYSFTDILKNATKKKLGVAKGGSATFKIDGNDEIKGKTVTVEKVDLKWDKKKKLTVRITGTPASNAETNVADLSGENDGPITGDISAFLLTFNNAGARFLQGESMAYAGKKKTCAVTKDKGKASENTFTLVNWYAKGKK